MKKILCSLIMFISIAFSQSGSSSLPDLLKNASIMIGMNQSFFGTDWNELIEDIEDEGDKLVHLLKYGINTIYDDETVYDTDDVPTSEMTEFVESLTLEQVDKLNEFFENIPTLSQELEYKCNSCGKEQSTTLKGLQSFF